MTVTVIKNHCRMMRDAVQVNLGMQLICTHTVSAKVLFALQPGLRGIKLCVTCACSSPSSQGNTHSIIKPVPLSYVYLHYVAPSQATLSAHVREGYSSHYVCHSVIQHGISTAGFYSFIQILS